MATPSSGAILFSQVRDELGQSNPAAMSSFYNTANQAGSTGLMYHNLNMASGNATTAKVAIFDKYNVTQNYALTNWYNYDQAPSMVMTYYIDNQSPYGIDIDLQIVDSSNVPQGTIYSTPTIASGGTAGGTVSTGCVPSNVSTGYRIYIQGVSFNPAPTVTPPGPPFSETFSVTVTVDSASDTDGVGAGTTRTTYGGAGYLREQSDTIPPSPPIPNIDPFPAIAVDSGGSLIPNNKRTTLAITIT
jgi:hypothetical protein